MFETDISPNCKIGVAFMQSYVDVGARYHSGAPESQRITVAIVRPLQRNGRPERGLPTYTGVAICNPNDGRSDAYGKRVALARALSQMLPGEDRHELRLMAYAIVREMYPPEKPAEKKPLAVELQHAVPASELAEVAA